MDARRPDHDRLGRAGADDRAAGAARAEARAGARSRRRGGDRERRTADVGLSSTGSRRAALSQSPLWNLVRVRNNPRLLEMSASQVLNDERLRLAVRK